MHRWSGEVLSSIGKIPNKSDGGKPGKHNRSVVHSLGIDGDGDGHAENDDGETDPHDADTVDQRSKFAKRVGRVLDDLAAAHEIDGNGDTVGGGKTDGGDTGEGVESSGGSEVDAPQNAIDNSGEDESVDGHIQLCVDTAP